MIMTEGRKILYAILKRYKVIELLSKYGFYNLISKIAFYISTRIDRNSKYTVVCIGRPIFNEEINSIANNSGKINYLIIPKFIFISIFNHHFNYIPFDHVNYHKDSRFNREKAAYRSSLNKFLNFFLNIVAADAFMSANYVYSWQQELAVLCQKKKIPFIVLHKEGMTSKTEYKNLVNTYTNGNFIGSKLLVYNNNIKNSLLNADIKNISCNNVIVVGVPRFDDYYKLCKPSGNQLTFFSFYIEDKTRHVGISEDLTLAGLHRESLKFHMEIMKFAERNNEIQVTIKTKASMRYLDYVKNIAKRHGFDNLENLIITNHGSVFNLIQDSLFVIGLNSSVLIEALIANRRIITPRFHDNIAFEDYFQDYEELVFYADSCENIESIVFQGSEKMVDKGLKNNLLKDFISTPDGKSSVRVEDEIILSVNESKENQYNV